LTGSPDTPEQTTTLDPHPQGRLIEIFFSVIQKKVVSPNDFASLDQLSSTLLAFVGRYNQTARPFNWKFTAADLADLLHRISEHEQAATTNQTDLATAA